MPSVKAMYHIKPKLWMMQATRIVHARPQAVNKPYNFDCVIDDTAKT